MHRITMLLLGMIFFFTPAWADVIVVDAGHGGKDSGAIYETTLEKDITLAIARKLAKALGDNAILTRDGDYYLSLRRRCEIANEKESDLFISIHVNSSAKPPSKSGAEVWYYEGSKEGNKIARKVAQAIGAKRGVKAGRFYVLKHTRCPAILIEVGFINDEKDRQNMIAPKWQDKFVKAVAKVIKNIE